MIPRLVQVKHPPYLNNPLSRLRQQTIDLETKARGVWVRKKIRYHAPGNIITTTVCPSFLKYAFTPSNKTDVVMKAWLPSQFGSWHYVIFGQLGYCTYIHHSLIVQYKYHAFMHHHSYHYVTYRDRRIGTRPWPVLKISLKILTLVAKGDGVLLLLMISHSFLLLTP